LQFCNFVDKSADSRPEASEGRFDSVLRTNQQWIYW